MAREVFVDASGLYALADRRDPARTRARSCVADLIDSRTRLILTDYILDEAATLAKVRAGIQAALSLLDIVDRSSGFQVIWIGTERFAAARAFFRKHAGHGYSFTDCTSFVVMRELGIRKALTTDRHFLEAGFQVLL